MHVFSVNIEKTWEKSWNTLKIITRVYTSAIIEIIVALSYFLFYDKSIQILQQEK